VLIENEEVKIGNREGPIKMDGIVAYITFISLFILFGTRFCAKLWLNVEVWHNTSRQNWIWSGYACSYHYFAVSRRKKEKN